MGQPTFQVAHALIGCDYISTLIWYVSRLLVTLPE